MRARNCCSWQRCCWRPTRSSSSIDGGLLDVRVWALMLTVQSIPYAAAVLVSLISAIPRLPGRLIGAMNRLPIPGRSDLPAAAVY